MTILSKKPKIDLNICLEMNEEEARALDALIRYDVDEFLKVFYEKIGKSYLEPYEKGLRSLFTTSREPLSMWLDRLEKARKVFDGSK